MAVQFIGFVLFAFTALLSANVNAETVLEKEHVLLVSPSSHRMLRAVLHGTGDQALVSFEACEIEGNWVRKEAPMSVGRCKRIHPGLFSQELATRLIEEFPRALEYELKANLPVAYEYLFWPITTSLVGVWGTEQAISRGLGRKLFRKAPTEIKPNRPWLVAGLIIGAFTVRQIMTAVEGASAYFLTDEPQIGEDTSNLDLILVANKVPARVVPNVAPRVMKSVINSLIVVLQHQYEEQAQ